MSPITRHLPYIVTPGNHESYAMGQIFNFRFRMPNTPDNDSDQRQNHYYDFVIKNVYYMTINLDYILMLHPVQMPAVLAWMETRLIMAGLQDSLTDKVFSTHRPIICNDPIYTADCTINFYLYKPIEDLLVKYNITFVMNGHVHIYS